MLDKSNQQWLLNYARAHISMYLGESAIGSDIIPDECKNDAGCFVTLTKCLDNALRGCIGTFNFSRELYRNIAEMSVAAASRDPRFAPLKPTELAEIKLEISVLSPPKSTTPDQIEVGLHGIIIEQNDHKGVLLPQVATEYAWNVDTFLQQTCLKAGLKMNAWRDPNTEIYSFSAQVFSETTSRN